MSSQWTRYQTEDAKGCAHPDMSVEATLDDLDVFRLRCLYCGTLLLVERLNREEARETQLRLEAAEARRRRRVSR